MASSGLGDKAGTQSPGRGWVFVGALCLELGSPQSWENTIRGKESGVPRKEKKEPWMNGSRGESKARSQETGWRWGVPGREDGAQGSPAGEAYRGGKQGVGPGGGGLRAVREDR